MTVKAVSARFRSVQYEVASTAYQLGMIWSRRWLVTGEVLMQRSRCYEFSSVPDIS